MHRVVPELIIENYQAGRFQGEFSCVGMFLDLSGFSKMTDALMQHGQHGAEVLAGLMHSVFDPLVRSIFWHGGKIVSFAGDGIMALFPVEGDEKRTALRALASAWVIQQELLRAPERTTVYGTFPLSVKIGITVGSADWRILRSEDGAQATYYFRGSAVDGSADAEHNAFAREILLTARMNDLLGDSILTQPQGPFHRFAGFRGEAPQATPFTPPSVNLEIARIFMPEEVIVHDMRGEFRQIVNLFMRIPDLPDGKLADFINAVFELRKQYGGLLTRLDFGDKGCNLLMLWGAPVAYENDIGRALNFVIDLQGRMDFPITAGVTYYIAHAGYLGSEMCEDYTCYGWGVNLASRFMMNAPGGGIWVDERVARRVSQRFEIEYVGVQSFKGFAAEQKVFVLRRRKNEMDTIYQGEMVGRDDELARLTRFIEPLWQGRFAGVLALTGDAGIGKGRLIQAFYSSRLFDERKALWGTCMADQVLRRSFNPLRGWLFRYFGIRQNQPLDDRRLAFDSKIDDLLASIPDPDLSRELDRTRSILGALVDIYWDNSLYSQLDAEARYNNTFLALIALIKAESLRRPFILSVDDLHFVDPDTIAFLSQLKRSLSAAADAHPVAVILI
ncbi:MAG: adenylate/guanylate cyclase domain-containing protein, partial [Anaerolineales bacterium]|nr:adenylate/guanylate cyclase domain-containing protein [Anaerolineales bacterium]